MLTEVRADVAGKLPTQKPGQFFYLREGTASAFQARFAAVLPRQSPEGDLPGLARRTRPPSE